MLEQLHLRSDLRAKATLSMQMPTTMSTTETTVSLSSFGEILSRSMLE